MIPSLYLKSDDLASEVLPLLRDTIPEYSNATDDHIRFIVTHVDKDYTSKAFTIYDTNTTSSSRPFHGNSINDIDKNAIYYQDYLDEHFSVETMFEL